MSAQPIPLSEATGPAAALERALILATCTMVTFLYAMTVTIANVSLPQMQGALSATPDQITWVVTSNLVATAILTPLAGWLVARFGRRKLCNFAVIGFGAASLACGLSDSLGELVLFRALQGAFGAPLVPVSQAIVLDTYAKRQHGAVIAIFGIILTLALSVFERTREIGLLRAVGLSRRSVRAMIRWEAVITALFGTFLGLGLGILLGWAVVAALADEGLGFGFPFQLLMTYVIAAAIGGVVASIWPSFRGARTDVLEAISYE